MGSKNVKPGPKNSTSISPTEIQPKTTEHVNGPNPNLAVRLNEEISDDVFIPNGALDHIRTGKSTHNRSKSPEIKYLNTFETSILSEVSDVGSQFLNDIELINAPVLTTVLSVASPTPPSPPPESHPPQALPPAPSKPLVPCLSSVVHDYPPKPRSSLRFKTTILSSSKEKSFSKSLSGEPAAKPTPKGVRFSDHVMIIDNQSGSTSGSGGPKLKNDLFRIIQDRRVSSSKPTSTQHNNYHYHHHNRRLSNSMSPSEASSSPHHGYDPKSWSGISAFFSSSLDKRVIKS